MKAKLLITALTVPMLAWADAYLTANFANYIPSTFILENADGAELQSNVYRNIGNDKTVAWTAGQLANGYGRAALSPTRNADPTIQSENWMILPTVHVADADAVVRWEARSLHKHLPETYRVMARTTVQDEWHELYACPGERYRFTMHAASLSQYYGQDIKIAFVATTTQGFMLAVDNIYVGVPTDDAFTFECHTPRYTAGDQGTIKGTLTYFGNESKLTEIMLEGIGQPQSVSIPVMRCGDSVDVEFTTYTEIGPPYHYQICGVSDGMATPLYSDYVKHSYYERLHLLDRASGTWCINCPVMELTTSRLQDAYGDQLLVLEAHVNDVLTNSDYWDDYLSQKVVAIPALIPDHNLSDMRLTLKPSEDLSDVFGAETYTKIEITSTTEQNGEISVSTVTEFTSPLDNSADRYRVAYMLIADYHDPGNARFLQHLQSNSYRDEQYYYMPDIILPELMYYENVPVEASVAYSGVPKSLPSRIDATTPLSHHFSLPLPSVEGYTNLRVVAMVIDTDTGTVENAAVAPVAIGSISDIVYDSDATGTEYYDIMGRKVSPETPGIVIERKGLTTTKKININH